MPTDLLITLFCGATLIVATAALIVVLRKSRRLTAPGRAHRSIDERLHGRMGGFAIGRQIGGGGMAQIYAAVGPGGRQVALKVLRTSMMVDAEIVARFFQEGAVLNKLNAAFPDAPVVKCFGAGRLGEAQRPYLALQRLEGKTLAHLLEGGKLSAASARAIASDLCDALAATHNAGFCHNDISPGNVMITGHNGLPAAKLLDFGVADASHQATSLQRAVAFGKPAYMAPEICSGRAATYSSDLYSLGIVMYEMLTGRPPFQSASNNPVELMERQANMAPDPLPPGLPREIREIVARLLEKDPDCRPESSYAVKSALTAGSPSTAIPAPVAVPARATAAPRPAEKPETADAPRTAAAPRHAVFSIDGAPTRRRVHAAFFTLLIAVVASAATGTMWYGGPNSVVAGTRSNAAISNVSAPGTPPKRIISSPPKGPAGASVVGAVPVKPVRAAGRANHRDGKVRQKATGRHVGVPFDRVRRLKVSGFGPQDSGTGRRNNKPPVRHRHNGAPPSPPKPPIAAPDAGGRSQHTPNNPGSG